MFKSYHGFGNCAFPRVSGKRYQDFSHVLGKLGRPVKISGLGDSIMAGDNGGFANHQSTGAWIQKAAAYTNKSIAFNHGVSGMSAVGHRSVGSTKDDWLTKETPDIAVYGLGANDFSSSGSSWSGGTAASVKSAVVASVEEALAVSPIVVLVDPPNLPGKSTTDRATLNGYFAELAASYNNVFFANIMNDLYDGTLSGAGLTGYTTDGVHPNQRGSEVMARAYANWLTPHLKSVPTWDTTLALSTTGRFYYPTLSVGFAAANGGDYPISGTETLQTTPSNGLSRNSLNIAWSGSGDSITVWKGVAGSYASKWILYSFKVRGSWVNTDTSGRCQELITFSDTLVARSDFMGQLNTNGEWATITSMRLMDAGTTTPQAQMISRREYYAGATVGTANWDVAEFAFHDLAAWESAAGIDFNMP